MENLELQKWQLQQRLLAFKDEVDFWRSETKNNNVYKRHQSQVRAFVEILDKVRARIEPSKENPIENGEDIRERSKVVLGLFRIWQFLRGKLAQRSDARFTSFLWLADELAWLCYKPIYDVGLRQPPLVYLNGGYSPFTLTRKEEFQAESVPQELLRSHTLVEAMASLPFPVIGVPWYQIRSLADLPVIAHEVGHSVEADLDLTRSLQEAIRVVVADSVRCARWLAWASELFADLYGCLGCGRAFVSSLANFLSTEDAASCTDVYPAPSLRFRFNVEVLNSLNYKHDAIALSDRWQNIYPETPEIAEYLKEGQKVADAMLERVSDRGRNLRDFLQFEKQHKRAREPAQATKVKDPIPRGEDMLALLAAYRLAFDALAEAYSPGEIAENLPTLDRLEKAMLDALVPDVRAGEMAPTEGQRVAQEELETRSANLWLDPLRSHPTTCQG